MVNPLLKTFVETADRGSFTQAAETLYLSSTAIMKQINLLEKHIGLQLLVRTPRGIRLTEAGQSLYRDAKAMMKFSEEAVERAYQAQSVNRSVIRLGTSALYPCKNLMDLWGRISGEHPQFKLKIVPFEDTNTDAEHRELGKRYDVIVGAYDSVLRSEFSQCLPLGEFHFCVAMGKTHRLARRRRLNLNDLHGERLMMMPPGNSPSNDKLRAEIEAEHPQIELADAPHHYDLEVFNACEESGCLLLTLDNWADVHPSLVSVPLDVAHKLPYGIVYAKEPNEATRLFVEALAMNKR